MTVDPGSRGWNEHRHLPAPANLGSVSLYSGVGVPPASLANNGDFYFRKDGGAGTAIYQKRAGAWVAVA
jgi:hypothetical protein